MISRWTSPKELKKKLEARKSKIFVDIVSKAITSDQWQSIVAAKKNERLKLFDQNISKEVFSYKLTKPGLNDSFLTNNLQDVFDWARSWVTFSENEGSQIVEVSKSFKSFKKQSFPDIAQFENLFSLSAFAGFDADAEKGLDRIIVLWQIDHRLKTVIPKWKTLVDMTKSDYKMLKNFCNVFSSKPEAFRGQHLREIPISGMDTKFIERHKGLLEEVLISLQRQHSPNLKTFEQRLGFSLPSNTFIRVRDLDGSLLPFEVMAIPIDQFSLYPIDVDDIIIVENLATFYALPQEKRCIAIGGMGKAAPKLGSIDWLKNKQIFYIGDLDIAGLEILNSVRKHGLSVTSALMNLEIFNEFSEFHVKDKPKRLDRIEYLTNVELQLYNEILKTGMRLEQERIPISRFSNY